MTKTWIVDISTGITYESKHSVFLSVSARPVTGSRACLPGSVLHSFKVEVADSLTEDEVIFYAYNTLWTAIREIPDLPDLRC